MDPGWGVEKLGLSDRDVAAWEHAEQEIEAHRCGDIILRVVNADGVPLSHVPIRYRQQESAFRYGIHYPHDRDVLAILREAGINAATLFAGWKYVEPQRGFYNWEYLDKVWQPAMMRAAGLQLAVQGLNWFKPQWHVLPEYLLETPTSKLPELAYEHVGELARHWGAYVQRFEIVSEPFWREASAIELDLEDMLRLCHATALAIRDVLPTAQLEVGFGEISRIRSYGVRPCDLVEALEKQGVPYDALALYCFENAYSVTKPQTFYRAKTFTGILQTLRQYAALGKPLHIAALAVPSVPPQGKMPSYFKLPYGPWDEERQAAYLHVAYTLLLAQPEVEGITWWCPVDGRLSYIAGGGLLRQDLSPKLAYHALRDVIQRHMSAGQVHTDDEGQAIVRGYAGEYELTVGGGGRGRRIVERIEARMVSEVTVVLDHTMG